VVASWRNDFCLPFKLIKIFSDLLSMGAVQPCASSLLNSNLISEQVRNQGAQGAKPPRKFFDPTEKMDRF